MPISQALRSTSGILVGPGIKTGFCSDKAILQRYVITLFENTLFCWEIFEEQKQSYKDKVLSCKNDTLLVSVEAGITDGWQKYTGRFGLNIGINSYGESAPGVEVAKHFGLTADSIYKKIMERMEK